jgi:hypothetical protein
VEHSRPVAFGANTVASCAVPLTSAQLEAFCRGQNVDGVPPNNPGIPLQLMAGLLDTDQPTVIGRWGNSDATNVNEWVEVWSPPPSSARKMLNKIK